MLCVPASWSNKHCNDYLLADSTATPESASSTAAGDPKERGRKWYAIDLGLVLLKISLLFKYRGERTKKNPVGFFQCTIISSLKLLYFRPSILTNDGSTQKAFIAAFLTLIPKKILSLPGISRSKTEGLSFLLSTDKLLSKTPLFSAAISDSICLIFKVIN